MEPIADFDSDEMAIIQTVVDTRYRCPIPLNLADVEVQLEPSNPARQNCAAVHWLENDANFIVIKTGNERYRGQFFYSPSEIFPAERDEYKQPAECIHSLLKIEANHALKGA